MHCVKSGWRDYTMVKALATEAGGHEVRFPEAHKIASVLPVIPTSENL